MAVVNRNSVGLANATATPLVLNSPARGESELREKVAVVLSAADDTAASIGRFLRLPSNARVSNLLITAADATTAAAIDVGLYDVDDGAVVDADFFASAFDLALGPFAESEIKDESGVSYTTVNLEKTIWELLGLTSDPGKEYDVAYTITATFNGGPVAIALKARYVR